MRSIFGAVVYMVVVGGQASNCGFARNCKSMILTAFPGMPREVFDREDIKKMMFEVDNVSGALYVIEPVEGNPLIMNSTLEGLQKEYDEWLDRTSQQQSSQ